MGHPQQNLRSLIIALSDGALASRSLNLASSANVSCDFSYPESIAEGAYLRSCNNNKISPRFGVGRLSKRLLDDWEEAEELAAFRPASLEMAWASPCAAAF